MRAANPFRLSKYQCLLSLNACLVTYLTAHVHARALTDWLGAITRLTVSTFLPVVHTDTFKFMELKPAEFAIAVLHAEAVNMSCGNLCFHLWTLGRRDG